MPVPLVISGIRVEMNFSVRCKVVSLDFLSRSPNPTKALRLSIFPLNLSNRCICLT